MTAYLYLLLVASLALPRPFSFTLFGLVVSLSDLIFVAAGLAWAADVVRRRSSVHPSGFYLVLGLYFGAMCLSAATSTEPRQSAAKLLAGVYLIGLAVLTVNMVRSWTFLRAVMSAWTVG